MGVELGLVSVGVGFEGFSRLGYMIFSFLFLLRERFGEVGKREGGEKTRRQFRT